MLRYGFDIFSLWIPKINGKESSGASPKSQVVILGREVESPCPWISEGLA
jgi:hypothetical protein